MASLGSRAGMRRRPILAVLLLVGAIAGPAGASELYTAVVTIPLAAPTDPVARDGAVEAAQALALEVVLERLTAVRDHAALPTASGPNVAGYVESLTVLTEDGGAMRARVALRADAVRQLLEGLGVEHATEPGPRLVVVPVYMPSEQDQMLWSGPNPWLDAWAEHSGEAALVPIVAPYGELGDLQALSTAEAIDGDGPALAALAARYEAAGTLVAIYELQGGQAQVRLSVAALPDWTEIKVLPVTHTEPISAGTIADTMAAIDRMWLERRIRPSYDGPISTIELTAVFDSLQDWIEIRRALDDAPVVERFEVPMVSGQTARILLRHYASLAVVQADFAGAGLTVEQGAPTGLASAGLIVRLAGAPMPSVQPGFAASAPGIDPYAAQGAQPPSAWPNPAPTGAPPTIAPTIPTLRYQP